MNGTFEFEEDQKYFEQHFESMNGLESNDFLFDFRSPLEKRKEFNSMRGMIFDQLIDAYGVACQLCCHQDCTKTATVVDHLMPISTNRLNKELRGMKAVDGKKAPTQSFGSNDIKNFVLSCSRCNAFKQNKIPDVHLLQHVYKLRGLV